MGGGSPATAAFEQRLGMVFSRTLAKVGTPAWSPAFRSNSGTRQAAGRGTHVDLAGWLRRLLRGEPSPSLPTRLSEAQAIALAKEAASDHWLRDALSIATAPRNASGAVVWSVETAGVGSGLRVEIEDASGRVLERRSYRRPLTQTRERTHQSPRILTLDARDPGGDHAQQVLLVMVLVAVTAGCAESSEPSEAGTSGAGASGKRRSERAGSGGKAARAARDQAVAAARAARG